MSFKINLLQKINIDNMARKTLASIGPVESERKVDKETMRCLIELCNYEFRRVRDLELYIKRGDTGKDRIFALDDGLTIYNATVDDVALRKSPTVKEMISIRNVVKILNDKDVVVSRKADSVKAIQKECIDALDLAFDKSDIEEIEQDGVLALERIDTDGVIECLSLFAELLKYMPPPKTLEIGNCYIIGALDKKKDGKTTYGPIIIYNIADNVIKLIDYQIENFDREKKEMLHNISVGKQEASMEGTHVFQYLKEKVIN